MIDERSKFHHKIQHVTKTARKDTNWRLAAWCDKDMVWGHIKKAGTYWDWAYSEHGLYLYKNGEASLPKYVKDIVVVVGKAMRRDEAFDAIRELIDGMNNREGRHEKGAD